MNEYMIKQWNNTVKEEDTIFHLGDLGRHCENIKKRLKGNIIWVKGNHDKPSHSPIIDLTIRIRGKNIYLVHNPADAYGEYNIVGHVHNAWTIKRLVDEQGEVGVMINVSVERWGYKPVSIKTILKTIERFKDGNI